MGLLPDDWLRADYGNDTPFISKEEAMTTVDLDHPPVGATYNIAGHIYKLMPDLTFEEVVG